MKIEQIKAMLQEGSTKDEICNSLGISRQNLKYYCAVIASQAKEFKPSIIRDVTELKSQGLNILVIAQRLKMSNHDVAEILRRDKLKLIELRKQKEAEDREIRKARLKQLLEKLEAIK